MYSSTTADIIVGCPGYIRTSFDYYVHLMTYRQPSGGENYRKNYPSGVSQLVLCFLTLDFRTMAELSSSSGPNQAEHTHISTALEVEQLDVNLFRSKTLWVPVHSRGVFGGQVISQAIVSATNCVDKGYGLHVSVTPNFWHRF